jgi:putative copper export protein/mono/diheme cytochrome c family protein
LSTPLVVARVFHFASAVVVFGAILFLWVVVDPSFRAFREECALAAASLRRRLLRFAWLGLAVAVASGAAWLLLLAAAITGTSAGEALSDSAVWTVLTETQFGQVWLVRSGLVVCVALLLARFDPAQGWRFRVEAALATALTGALLASLAWAGHSGGGSGFAGAVGVAADAAHLLAAGGWVGTLAPLALLLAKAGPGAETDRIPPAIAADATLRFSLLGIIVVATLLATGLLNTWSLVGGVPQLVGTDYGRLLLVKIALFITMLGLAVYNRLRLVPRLNAAGAESSTALHRLRQDSTAEVVLGILILSIVALLGALPPAAHSQAQWPFSFRVDFGILSTLEFRTRLAVACAAIVTGAALFVSGLWLRRWRWLLIAAGVALVAWFLPDLRLLTVEAFPTSFYLSPTGYAAESIAAGKRLFAVHCASCHGADGEGGGPAAKSLSVRPGDLTSDHVYIHRDGDLFWWISNGVGAAMPAFAAVLDAQKRWNLIDFIHANADAPRLRRTAGEVTGSGYPAPDISFECPDGSTISIRDLQGRPVRLLLGGSRVADRLQRPPAVSPGDLFTAFIVGDISFDDRLPICLNRDATAISALALYAGRDEADVDGIEILIDQAGELRSIWYPKQRRPDWNDPVVFARILDDLKKVPSSAGRTAPPVHSH